jgi:arylformamidase
MREFYAARCDNMARMKYDAEFVEREYNNRARVPDYGDYFARWEKDSKYVRETMPSAIDIPYGPDPRHRIDVFPAKGSRGTLVFFHGGYWRSLDKSMFSWLAASWTAAGIGVAMPNYRLAPGVRIEGIVDDAIAAADWVMRHGAEHGLATGRVVISGHSAGGHLTAALFATRRERLDFDARRIAGGVPISGVFDFEPLMQFSFNADFKLDAHGVQRLNLADKNPTIDAPLVVAVGADETSEFVRQSQLIAGAWSSQVKELQVLPGLHHFSIVDAFAERGQRLYEATLGLF